MTTEQNSGWDIYGTMETLRKRRGLEEDDTSQDDEIKKMKPVQVVRELTAWELGSGEWADMIAGFMDDAGAKPEDFEK